MIDDKLDPYEDESTPWRDGSVLRELYHEDGLTQEEIAECLGCGKNTIIKWMDKNGIEADGRTDHFEEKYGDAPWRDGDLMEELYLQKKLSSVEMADKFGCTSKTVLRWLRHHEIRIRDASSTPAPLTTVKSGGYEEWSGTQDGDRIRVHQLLMMVSHSPKEVLEKEVHHENHIPWDNRMSNLTLMEKSEHSRHHALDRLEKGTSHLPHGGEC